MNNTSGLIFAIAAGLLLCFGPVCTVSAQPGASAEYSAAGDTSDIVVAVVDTGVDYTHPDLKNMMWDEGPDYPELAAMGGGRTAKKGKTKKC